MEWAIYIDVRRQCFRLWATGQLCVRDMHEPVPLIHLPPTELRCLQKGTVSSRVGKFSGTPWRRLWRTEGRLCNSQKQLSLCGGKWVPCVVMVWAGPLVLVYLPHLHNRILTGPIHHSFLVYTPPKGSFPIVLL